MSDMQDGAQAGLAGGKRKREDEPAVQQEQEAEKGIVAAADEARAKKARNDARAAERDAEDDDADARPSFGGASAPNAVPSVSVPNVLQSDGGIGAKLLRLAGYSGAGGLGKRGTGMVEPVRQSDQVATEGIGFQKPVQAQQHEYEEFRVEVELRPVWLTQPTSSNGGSLPLPSLEDTADWMEEGERDPRVLSDVRYCSLDVQEALLDAKSAFDGVPSHMFRSARERSNPFEKIKGEFFQNRAALKMTELDKMCDRLFTQPACARPVRGGRRELLQVGDICAGPGGFSEFMLTVLKWRAQVMGFTLKASNDFNTSKFNRCAPTGSFHASYGADGTGDITNNANMRAYREEVMQRTKGKGLHVIMADGGFSVVGRENMQEYLSRQLVLCQFLVALWTLRPGGVFVCKLFDSFLPFTVHLLHILRVHFTHFALVKPNQSRPANSERYVVVHGLRKENPPIVQYLLRVNERINALKAGYSPLSKASLLEGVTDFGANKNNSERDRNIHNRQLVQQQQDRGSSLSARNNSERWAPQRFTPGGREGGDRGERADDGGGGRERERGSGRSEREAGGPGIDRGDGKDMFGRDIVQEEEPAAAGDASASTEQQSSAAARPSTVKRISEPDELDVLGLVPASVLDADPAFTAYVLERNEVYAARQIFTLRRLKRYLEDRSLRTDDQEAVRQECLAFWELSQAPQRRPPPIEELLPKEERRRHRDMLKAQQQQQERLAGGKRRGRSQSRSRSRSRSPRRGRDADQPRLKRHPRGPHSPRHAPPPPGRSRSRSPGRSPSRSLSPHRDSSSERSASGSDRSRSRSSSRSRSKRRTKRKSKVLSDSDSTASRASSRSRSRSRGRSRSPRRKTSSAAAPSASASAKIARSSSRSPTPPPEDERGRLYVHFDPLWQQKHFDPSYPANAAASFFWTNARTRHMVEEDIPADIRQSLQLLPLPSESERAALRLAAEKDPSLPPEPRMLQSEMLGRHARSWLVFQLPAGGTRHTVWFGAGGMGHIGADGRPVHWNMQPPMRVPADTVLDIVYVNGVCYALDAWSLPSPADLFAYRSRPRLSERAELLALLVESCCEPRLQCVAPFPLLEWKKQAAISETVARAHQYDPPFDLYFLRDGPRPKEGHVSYSWTARDHTTFLQVDQLINYVISKQLPAGAPAPSTGGANTPQQQRSRPPVAIART